MIHRSWRPARGAVAAVTVVVAFALTLPFASPASAGPKIRSAGSTWSANAVKQWVADVSRNGIDIDYADIGSTDGRNYFMDGTVDFAVSEVPFWKGEEFNRLQASGMGYSYVPIVAGGTAFPYNLPGVTDLKLSPETAAKIFTGRIERWNDPAIVADTGHPMPDLPLFPVLRSDGSGTSAQLAYYFRSQASGTWNEFLAEQGYPNDDNPVELWPTQGAIARGRFTKGSEGVTAFVKQNPGTITYVEASYGIKYQLPMSYVRNSAGKYALPTAANVAVALSKAKLKPDRSVDLSDVYTAPDPAAYPISSYSLAILRKDHIEPDKAKDISRFLYYSVCGGQQKARGGSGYSPLPPQLVTAAFEGIREMPGADPAPQANAQECKNPTITGEGVGGTPKSIDPPAAKNANQNGAGKSGASGAAGNSASKKAATGASSGAGPDGSGSTGSEETAGGELGELGADEELALGEDALATVATPAVVEVNGSFSGVWLLIAAALGLLLLVIVPPLYAALTSSGGTVQQDLDRQRRHAAERRQRSRAAKEAAFLDESPGAGQPGALDKGPDRPGGAA